MLKALRRALCWWWWPPEEWRVVKYADGLWYVKVKHMDHGWVHVGSGYKSMIEAAAEGRKLYGKEGMK